MLASLFKEQPMSVWDKIKEYIQKFVAMLRNKAEVQNEPNIDE
jgi:hypothetical protein